MSNDRFADAGTLSATLRQIRGRGFGVILAWLLVAQVTSAEISRTQTITIHRGWNAVYLQVSPTNRDPSAVFANTPFDIVGTYFPVEKAVQYIQNPSSVGWN